LKLKRIAPNDKSVEAIQANKPIASNASVESGIIDCSPVNSTNQASSQAKNGPEKIIRIESGKTSHINGHRLKKLFMV
jgi:hypothetical protein